MTDWKETIEARSYVLYRERDRGGDVSFYDNLSGAKAALREIASRILAAGGEDLPDNDRDIVRKLAEYGEYARIYKCNGNDDGDGDWESFLLVEAIEVEEDDETANKTAA